MFLRASYFCFILPVFFLSFQKLNVVENLHHWLVPSLRQIIPTHTPKGSSACGIFDALRIVVCSCSYQTYQYRWPQIALITWLCARMPALFLRPHTTSAKLTWIQSPLSLEVRTYMSSLARKAAMKWRMDLKCSSSPLKVRCWEPSDNN